MLSKAWLRQVHTYPLQRLALGFVDRHGKRHTHRELAPRPLEGEHVVIRRELDAWDEYNITLMLAGCYLRERPPNAGRAQIEFLSDGFRASEASEPLSLQAPCSSIPETGVRRGSSWNAQLRLACRKVIGTDPPRVSPSHRVSQTK